MSPAEHRSRRSSASVMADRQLRFPRARDAPVHGRAPQGGRDGGRRGPGDPRAAVWKALGTGSWDAGGADSRTLRSVPLPKLHPGLPRPGYGNAYPELGQMPGDRPRPDAVPDRVCRRRERHFCCCSPASSAISPSPFGSKGQSRPLSTQMYLPGLAPGRPWRTSSARCRIMSRAMFLTGKATYPVERTLLDDRNCCRWASSRCIEGSSGSKRRISQASLPVTPRIDCSFGTEPMRQMPSRHEATAVATANLRATAKSDGDHHDRLAVSVARPAYGRPIPGGLSL